MEAEEADVGCDSAHRGDSYDPARIGKQPDGRCVIGGAEWCGMKKYLLPIISAALLFWVPDVVVHLIAGRSFSGADVRLMTVLIPLICVTGFMVCPKLCYGRLWNATEAMVAVGGIWLMGPLATMVAATFSGGGFAAAPYRSLGEILMLGTLLFPIYTFMLSAYDGTLFALMIVTVILLVYAIIRMVYENCRSAPASTA